MTRASKDVGVIPNFECRYHVGTGIFEIGTPTFWYQGYSGAKGPGRNNSGYDAVRNIGPIPSGEWFVSGQYIDRPTQLTFRLQPAPGTETKGRSGFLIHGDNPQQTASRGCIILPLTARQRLSARLGGGTGRLWVIAGHPAP